MPFKFFRRRSKGQKNHGQQEKKSNDMTLRQLSQQEHWLSRNEEKGWAKLPRKHPERQLARARYLDRYFEPPRSKDQRDLGPTLLRRVHEILQGLLEFRPVSVNHNDSLDELLDVLEECEIALSSIKHRNRWLGQEIIGLEDSLQLCNQQKATLTTRVTD